MVRARAGGRGRGTTGVSDVDEATRAKISEALVGRPKSAETRRRMSEGRAGEKNHRWEGGFSEGYGPDWGIVRRDAYERDEVC
nr:NUMOD3 domain-containing DNA-binding protein [Halarchaeum solikamskense]